MRAEDLYLAFGDGALTYDCRSCGRCCRGLGFGGEAGACRRSPLTRSVAAFLDARSSDGPLAMYHTFADGCRYQGDEGLCDVHRDRGRGAKPLLCRLFPLSRMVDVDGLWAVLPHGQCPWRTRSGTEPDTLSAHGAILDDLGGAGEGFLERLEPRRVRAVTPLAPDLRRRIEEAIRDALSLDCRVEQALDLAASIQARGAERAAVPAVEERALFGDAIPAGLRAFVLWLRALLGACPRRLGGDDLLSLLPTAMAKLWPLRENHGPQA